MCGLATHCSKANKQAGLNDVKESLLYFRRRQLGWGGWQTSVQRSSPPSAPYPRIGNQWTGAFIDRSGEGALCRNNTVSSDSHLQIDHQWSGQHYVGYLGTVILQFQGPLVPISLQSLLRIVAAHVLSTVWSSSS